MNNNFRTVTKTGFSQNIGNSFIGAIIGVLLFFSSFFVIWFTEGRTNLATVAADSVSVSAETLDAANEGKFVAVTGKLSANTPLGDPPFLQEGNYLQLNRSVEMYAWIEESKTTEKENVGGSSESITDYSYKQDWTDSPQDSNDFKVPEGHTNPGLAIQETTLVADDATLGAFTVDLNQLTLPTAAPLTLGKQNVIVSLDTKLENGFLFQGKGSLTSPKIGDVRISYSAVSSPAAVTTFGRQSGESLAGYEYESGSLFLRALSGDRTSAIATLQSEHTTVSWFLRLGSFLMNWFGVMLALSPLAALAGVLPFLKRFTSFVTSVIAFVTSLILWSLATMISIVLQNIWLALIAALVVIGVLYFWVRQRQSAPVAAGNTARVDVKIG